MEFSIKDGSSGNVAKVDRLGRVNAYSISETILEFAAENGDSYNINTGTINLTSANESAVMYFKNNGDKNIVIAAIGFLLGNSTGGTGNALIKVLRNPTAGTIVSAATPVAINKNKNAGSSKTLTVDAYAGAEASAFDNGEDFYLSLLPGVARSYTISTGGIHLPKGSSIGITFTPPSSNTSMDMMVFLSTVEYESL